MPAASLFSSSSRTASIAVVFLAALFGASLAFYLYGWGIIDPTNVHWLLTEGDPFQHFIGWDAFRRDEWRWPLGAIPQLGTLIDSSIVFTDSIPLLALPLKLFHAWLSDPFQYQGLVMLINLTLNAALACALAQRLGARPLNAVLFAVLVALLPMVTLRGLGAHGHEALTAHWLILLAVLYSLSARPVGGWVLLRWLILMLTAVLVHFYLFFMVGTLWFAWWACQLWRTGRTKQWPGLFYLLAAGWLSAVLVLATMWAVGYLQYGLEVGRDTGFGYYSAEFLTYLNPLSAAWFFDGDLDGASRLIPGWITRIPGQYEGQAYAGVGALVLLTAGLLVAVRRGQWSEFAELRLETRVLALALVGLFLFALGDRWIIGKVVTNIPYPDWTQVLTQYLRSSGRLVWPLLYGLLLLALVILMYKARRRTLSVVLGVAVVLQWLDLADMHGFIRDNLDQRVAAAASGPPFAAITDPRLNALLETRERIDYLPGDDLEKLKPYVWLAVRHDLPLNVAYFARVNAEALLKATAPQVDAIQSGALEEDTLYVITNDELSQRACEIDQATCFDMDGVMIVTRAR
nr:DUF6311 domain-containing protein [uncultured Halomonas sp.]